MRDQDQILWRVKVCWIAGASPQRLMPMLSQLDDQHAAALSGWIRTGRGGAALGGALVLARRRGAAPQGREALVEAAHRAWRVACRRLVRHSPLAGDSIGQVYEWLWLLGADEACEAMARAPWRVNGAPKLRAAALHMRRWPWGVDPALLLMASGQPCRPDCQQGCPTEPVLAPVDVAAAARAPGSTTPTTPPATPSAATGRKGMQIAQTSYPARSWAVRLAAGAAAVLVAVALVVAAAASPARAAGGVTVETTSTCEALEVLIDPGHTKRTWVVTATVDGSDWTWPAGDLAPAGQAPDNGWIARDPHTVTVPAGATGVDVAWWHGQGDPDPAADGWVVALDEAAWTHPGGDACGTPDVTVEKETCPSVQLAFTNPTEHFFSADVRVDGEAGIPDQWSDMKVKEGPHAGELFGDRYRAVDIPPGQTRRLDVGFDDFSGEHLVEYVIRRGAEQQWYVPWGEVTVDCGTPQPTPTPTTPPSSPEAAAGGGGQLPETGTSVLLTVIAAVALLGAGGGAVAVARRRRIHFRA